jgi:hypothetical protein
MCPSGVAGVFKTRTEASLPAGQARPFPLRGFYRFRQLTMTVRNIRLCHGKEGWLDYAAKPLLSAPFFSMNGGLRPHEYIPTDLGTSSVPLLLPI